MGAGRVDSRRAPDARRGAGWERWRVWGFGRTAASLVKTCPFHSVRGGLIAMERLLSPSWRSAVHSVVRLFLSSVAPMKRSTIRVGRSRVTSRAKMIGEICIQLFSRNIRGPQRQGGQNLMALQAR